MLTILVGPSAAGKTAISEKLLKRGVKKMVTATSRDPRPGETHGKDYFFLPREEFTNHPEKFFETAEYAGNFYGMPVNQLNIAAMSNDAYVVVMEIEGAKKVREAFPGNVLLVYINRAKRDLIKAINARPILSSEKRIRVKKLEEDMLAKDECDYTVSNHNGKIDKAVEQIYNVSGQHFGILNKVARNVITIKKEDNHDV